ncbi:hypothetical protein [Aeromicrobium choanae]|uniref:Protoporphyrinogen oxidase n=1 Tax=Aeromicrobium choanae TaxID=1736691 RepID=A0A1T4YZC3_9ACTN|nr:hypothetical protein [Aeromicrobium choanae]SKB06983.1 hypothetical protein SAMN06295964_1528 [Aeromicrobium choanae]
MKKLALLTAAAVGYVLGTRAGRGRYEQIKQQAERVWHTDPVQSTAHKAQDTAKQAASDVGHRVAETAKDVSGVVSEKAKDVSGTVSDKVKTAADFSNDDANDSGTATGAGAGTGTDADASAPAYSTSSEGLRADAAAADARAPFDIDEAGSDDLSSQPNPLGTDDPDARA